MIKLADIFSLLHNSHNINTNHNRAEPSRTEFEKKLTKVIESGKLDLAVRDIGEKNILRPRKSALYLVKL